MSFTEVLTTIGGFMVVFHLLKLAWRCWCGLREFVLSELWQEDLRTYGQWAVVTGATSGIGKAYASELAQRGLDVILVSRSDDKLRMVAKEIEDRFGRKTRIIQADFTESNSIYPAIAKELQGLEIGILVNNVGMTYSDHFAYFLEIPDAEQKITQVINCNMLSVPQMTRLVLPGMIERRKGLIINISSEVGIRPQPLLSLYSATKIFVTYFSQCLHAEYKSKGIIVQCVAPFMVSTNMTNNMNVNYFVKSASGFAHEALNTVGHSSYTSGCLSHALQVREMSDYDHLHIVSCCNILTSHLLFPVISQDMALTILMPDWIRMSTFLIRKLRNLAEMNEHEVQACREEKLREKEE
ncbi:hydroxysteroid (20-beta) dehydrogenase 2 isoform X1 [Seriola aureovittata]|uniref:hydroxysteroid (20-beta) dehydrogenase 2 isoform X1 n=2 Tax=Seriola aureovittata TaxID=2871759 RepID=UPI0024BF027D|nr:hydroxysteroid (20-beta) dehydrogenase 2 isoform X1 [Seriola aureovittata]